MKRPPKQIREDFDRAAHFYEQLALKGESEPAIIDSSLTSHLIIEAAAKVCPQAEYLLDVGCGGGLYSLKMLKLIPGINIDLHDFSQPMLDGAYRNVSNAASGRVRAIKCDVRNLDVRDCHYDIVLAGAVLHHLREDDEWESVFAKLYNCLKPGGCLWISDLVTFSDRAVTKMMWDRYGDYLEELRGLEFRQWALNQIEQSDSPRSIVYQLDLMREVGFEQVEVLHFNTCFAAYGGIKTA